MASDTDVDPITLSLLPGTEFSRLWGGDEAPTFPDDGSPRPAPAYFPPLGGFRFGLFTVAPDSVAMPKDLDMQLAVAEIEETLSASSVRADADGLSVSLESRLVLNHPLLDQLDSSVCDLVPGEEVEFDGEWTTSSRRVYKSEAQTGSGLGPFVEVVDFRWRGALTSAGPISGIAFLLTADNLYWAKAPEVALTLPVDVSLHAYAGYMAAGATFTASLAGACLPGVPVAGSADLAGACALGPHALITGRVACLARAHSAAFFVLLIQRGLLKMGRKRLWRLRDDVASSLPPGIRELLVHRRAGSVRVQAS